MSVLFVHFSVLFAIEYTAKLESVHVMNVNGWEVNFFMKFTETDVRRATWPWVSACVGAYVSIAYKVNYPRQTEKVKWMI